MSDLTSTGPEPTPMPQSSSLIVRLAPPGHVIALSEVTLGSAGPAVIISIDGDQTTDDELVLRCDGGGFDGALQLLGLLQAAASNLMAHLDDHEPESAMLVRETVRAALADALEAETFHLSSGDSITLNSPLDGPVQAIANRDALLDALLAVAL